MPVGELGGYGLIRFPHLRIEMWGTRHPRIFRVRGRFQPRWDGEMSGQASDSGDTVESSIEAQDFLDTVDLHDGDMDRVSRR